MPKAMIITVGGTPAPLIKSICEYRPEFISFLASQDTCDHVSQIKSETNSNGLQTSSEITLLDNVNDLLHCHNKAEEAVERVKSIGYRKEDVIVDYTGGTKNMSVALALAAIAHGYLFSYVGGGERTKEGVGIVINGREEIYPSVNPWDFLAVEERKNIAILFNQFQFKAAKDITDNLIERTTKFKSLFKKIGLLIDGYYKWDLFRHNEALNLFRRSRLEEIAEIDDVPMNKFAVASQSLMSILEEMVTTSTKPSHLIVLDMYSNADRRYKEGKVDDAVLRLYRLVEMLAQERLSDKYSIDSSAVKKEQIPERLRADFIANYKNHRKGRIEIPQTAAFKLLEALNDELGKTFIRNQEAFLAVQSSRNYSYLAHGYQSSKERTYLNFRDFILSLNMFNAVDAPVFPEMEI